MAPSDGSKEPISALAQEQTKQPPKLPSNNTREPAKQPANAPVESFEELLKLRPDQVKSLRVLPAKES